MRRALGLGIVVLVSGLGWGGVARGDAFGGFSADGTRYLDGKTQVCTPVDGAAAADVKPACELADKAAIKAYKFTAPKGKAATRDTTGWLGLYVVTSGAAVEVMAQGEGAPAMVASFDAGAEVMRTRGPWLSTDGKLLAVEAQLKTKKKEWVTRVWDVTTVMAGLRPAPDSLAAKLIALGTVWTQPGVACETAGVTVRLGKDLHFEVRTDVKCKGYTDRLRVAGAWKTEGDAGVVMTFPNQDGPDEVMQCVVAACSDDAATMCMTCGQGDTAFTVRPDAKASAGADGAKGGTKKKGSGLTR